MQPDETTYPPLEAAPPIVHREVTLPMFVQRLLQIMIVAVLPIFLVLGSVRLVMNEWFLKVEYNRPGFPEDTFGFSKEDRLEYGPYGVRYVLNDEDISYLGDLTIDGKPAFAADELQHMEDVKVVARQAFLFLWIVAAVFVGSSLALVRQPATRKSWRQAMRVGGLAVFGLVIVAIVVIVISWGFFFDSFHEAFFEAGTWQFSRSDTLIRLYPEQFWFDATLTIAILTILGASLSIFIAWYWERKIRLTSTKNPPEQLEISEKPA